MCCAFIGWLTFDVFVRKGTLSDKSMKQVKGELQALADKRLVVA